MPRLDKILSESQIVYAKFSQFCVNSVNSLAGNLYKFSHLSTREMKNIGNYMECYRYSAASEMATRFTVLPAAITLPLYPLYFYISRKQAGLPILADFNAASFLRGNWNQFLTSLVRGGPYVKKAELHEFVNGSEIVDEAAADRVYPSGLFKFTPFIRFISAYAAIESAIMQLTANLTLFEQIRNSKVEIKRANHLMRFLSFGYQERFLRSAINMGFLVMTQPVRAKVKEELPPEQYGMAAKIIAPASTGIISAWSCTALGVILTQRAAMVDKKTFKAPSPYKVSKAIYAKSGIPGFFVGSCWNMVTTVMAYGIIELFEDKMAATFTEEKRKLHLDCKWRPGLFHGVQHLGHKVQVQAEELTPRNESRVR